MTDTTDWSDDEKEDLADYEETEGDNAPNFDYTPCDPEDYGHSSN